MKIISFIYKKTVKKKIITHLNIYEEKENKRAPRIPATDYTERVKIVPYDDGWQEVMSRLPIFKSLRTANGYVCSNFGLIGLIRQLHILNHLE